VQCASPDATPAGSVMPDIFDILAPVIAMIAIGYVLARTSVVTPSGEAGLSAVVFYVTTPALLFRAMAGAAPGAADLAVVAAYFVPCLLLYAVWVVVARRRADGRLGLAGIGAMGACFGNTVLLGVPIVERLYGAPGLRLLVMIVSIHSAMLFTTTAVLLEADRGRVDGRAALAIALRTVTGNPIVLSIFAGAAIAVSGVTLPRAVDATLGLLGAATTPIALIAVGVSLAGLGVRGLLRPCAAISAGKLVVLPLMVWASCRFLFDLDDLAVAVATLTAALPSGTNVHVLARRHDVGVETAAGAIFASTLAAGATVPLVMLLLG
jgi:malonate transporter and related proteins